MAPPLLTLHLCLSFTFLEKPFLTLSSHVLFFFRTLNNYTICTLTLCLPTNTLVLWEQSSSLIHCHTLNAQNRGWQKRGAQWRFIEQKNGSLAPFCRWGNELRSVVICLGYNQNDGIRIRNWIFHTVALFQLFCMTSLKTWCDKCVQRAVWHSVGSRVTMGFPSWLSHYLVSHLLETS